MRFGSCGRALKSSLTLVPLELPGFKIDKESDVWN